MEDRSFAVDVFTKLHILIALISVSKVLSDVYCGSLVTGRYLQNRKMSMGNRLTERSPEVILYGRR